MKNYYTLLFLITVFHRNKFIDLSRVKEVQCVINEKNIVKIELIIFSRLKNVSKKKKVGGIHQF